MAFVALIPHAAQLITVEYAKIPQAIMLGPSRLIIAFNVISIAVLVCFAAIFFESSKSKLIKVSEKISNKCTFYLSGVFYCLFLSSLMLIIAGNMAYGLKIIDDSFYKKVGNLEKVK